MKKDQNIYDFSAVEHKWIERWKIEKPYRVEIDQTKEKFYCLDTWPYPSADGVHIGYVKSYCGMDVIARYKRMKGFNVLYPIGWDTLGLPAENFALRERRHPREITDESIQSFHRQFHGFGLSYDWDRELNTADPEYYRWTQWIFLMMYKNGLAYQKKSAVNWCPKDKTVLANEQVIDGACERCGEMVEQRELMQWFFKITDYADRLFEDCDKLQWEDKYLNLHKKWIGKEVQDNGDITFHIRDWSVARQRYWGPPIPIVYCDQCGTVPVPEEQLPVLLPKDIDFTPTGESPLASSEEFVHTSCPTCQGPARREVDILDTFVSSAWYQFRFPNPENHEAFVSKEAISYWKHVDHYQGSMEHLTAHLVYARFVTKVLYDHGYLPFDEPFPKYTPVGLLVDKSGTKFSKRLGNAPDTNTLIKEYGGDLLRLSGYFISPFDDISRWGIQDIVGVEKFRNRVWRIFVEKVDGTTHSMPDDLVRHSHQLIKDIEEAIAKMRFNVALSKMMVFISALITYDGMIDKGVWRVFVQLLAPFAPFIAEEMWHQMGSEGSVHLSSWPAYDAALITHEEVTIVVQVEGKTRGTIQVPVGSNEQEVLDRMHTIDKFSQYVRSARSTVFVMDKIINLLVH